MAKTVSEQLVNGVTYKIADSDARNAILNSVLAANGTNIADDTVAGDSLDFTTLDVNKTYNINLTNKSTNLPSQRGTLLIFNGYNRSYSSKNFRVYVYINSVDRAVYICNTFNSTTNAWEKISSSDEILNKAISPNGTNITDASVDDDSLDFTTLDANRVYNINLSTKATNLPAKQGTLLIYSGYNRTSSFTNFRVYVFTEGNGGSIYVCSTFHGKTFAWKMLSSGVGGVNSITSDVVLSSRQYRIGLIGDSITAGQGSTGFVSYTKTIEETTYSVRGNGPDYPSAGPGYQVGEFIYAHDSRQWYVAIDGHGWAQTMKAYFESKFNCLVQNYACSGINSSNLSDIIDDKFTENPFDLVIMTIGTNDRSANNLANTYNNVKNACSNLLQMGTKVILMGNIPASVGNEESYQVHMEDINHVIMKVAADLGIPFISLFSQMLRYCEYTSTSLDSLLADGLHPNDTGYQVMFNMICESLNLVPKMPGATW